MNIIHFLSVSIFFMGGTEPYVVEDSTALQPAKEQWILLRKLQNFNETRNDTKPLTWNELLADVLVNKIKIFSFKQAHETIEEKKSPLTNFVGQMLVLYKRFIYDKFSPTIKNNFTEIMEEPEITTEVGRDGDTTNHLNDTIVNDTKNSTDPKEEVEIIEPRYHGKLSESEEIADLNKEVEKCPEGYMKVDKVCVVDKSKLMIAVPSQCPIGYRRDGLGFCRLVF